MQPTKNLLIVEPIITENKTESGIIIKEAWKAAENKGIVQAVGPDVTTLKKGDNIFFNPYAAMNVDDGMKIISEKDVLATWEE